MRAVLALGANLGDRRNTLNAAAERIAGLDQTRIVRASSIYRSPPLLPAGAPPDWYKLFYNTALIIDTTLPPHTLLTATQQIESALGRQRLATWAPRPIDIDIIAYGDLTLSDATLTLPHPAATERSFVLAPLAEIAPDFRLNGRSVLAWKRALQEPLPAWMEIVNVTPDSFSGDGLLADDNGACVLTTSPTVNYIDLGAESTRPNARTLTPAEEWSRLEPVLGSLDLNEPFRPRVSIDTRHADTARQALTGGVDVINDVSGLADEAMLGVLADSTCDVVVMHNLGIPADPATTLDCEDPVPPVLAFLAAKLDQLAAAGISRDRVIVDPGIGFGKTALQSWQLLQRAGEFLQLDTRVLYGHSRKSFLKSITNVSPIDRDPHTLAISMALARQHVDIIRVHNIAMHHHAQEAAWRLNS